MGTSEKRSEAADLRKLHAEITALRAEVELMREELSVAQRNNSPATEAGRRGGARSYSQLGQDLWVLEKLTPNRRGLLGRLLEKLGAQKRRFFIDIGAADGILLSNTFLLEKHYGWDGLCIEPNPQDFEALKLNRRCAVSNACVWRVSGEEMEFILAREFGALARVADGDNHSAKRQVYRELGAVIQVRTTSLNDVLSAHEVLPDIDYISLDVEGAEVDILSTFDFAHWDVKLWTIEHNFTPGRHNVRSLMATHGYACKEAKWDDWYYRP
jgi:FkbM family methyltransferase